MPSTKQLIEQFKDSHTLPHVINQLTMLMADSESTMKDFAEVIEVDPVLVAKLLKMVNSPYFGLMQKADSIDRAVTFLGMKNLHSMVITDTLNTIFSKGDESAFFSRRQLWLHCAAVSICSKMVAERIFGINGDDAFLCSILHDFGLIVEQQVHQKEFAKLCKECDSSTTLVERENIAFSTDHCQIGFELTAQWGMSSAIQEAIRDHHNTGDEISPQSLCGMLQISEYLSAQQDYTTLPGMQMQISPNLLDHIEENLDEYSILMEDFPDEMTKAQALYGN